GVVDRAGDPDDEHGAPARDNGEGDDRVRHLDAYLRCVRTIANSRVAQSPVSPWCMRDYRPSSEAVTRAHPRPRARSDSSVDTFLKRWRRTSPGEGSYRRGLAALDEHRLDDAIEPLRAAAEAMPDRWSVWFDLGLAHKLRREWAESVAANRRAAQI